MCDHEMLQKLVNKDNIIEVGATPIQPDTPNEPTRFEALKNVLGEKIKTTVNLAEVAGRGYANKKDAESKKTFAEVQKTIEEASHIKARKEGEMLSGQLENIDKLFGLFDNIFKEDQDPMAKAMKLAVLFKERPEIIGALEDLEGTLKHLSFKKNCLVQFLIDRPSLESKDEELAGKLALPIKVLNLTARPSNCLEANNIQTVGELVKMTEADLLRIRSFGNPSLREVKRKLANLGLTLGMTDI